MPKSKSNKGFSLIELVVVCVIIGVLTSIALPKYRRTVDRARVGEALTLLRSIYDSCERYGFVHPHQDGNVTRTDCGSAVAEGATFSRLDIIVKGTFSNEGKTLTTDNFSYTLPTTVGGPVVARATKGDYAGAEIHFNGRILTCNTADATGEGLKACSVWGSANWNQD